MNIYSGTLSYTCNLTTSTFNGTGRGGVIQAMGPLNIYGGKIIGGDVTVSSYAFNGINGAGGAIYASAGPLNIYGGEITSGTCPESGAGPCIYMFSTSAKVFVANDAKVDDIYFTNLNPDRLTVSGAFTGKLGVTYAPSIVLSERQTVGIAANDCDLKKADITCGDYFIHADNGKLILSTYSAGIPAATGGVGYNTLQAAIDASTDGKVELLNDTPETVTVNKDITLQLHGCSVGGVNVAEGATLYLQDSATDDFTVADGIYGKISAVTGNVTGAEGYLLLDENGAVSAHLVRLNIHTMTLRVDNTDDKQEPGLYYKSDFKGDEKIAPQIATYGVALSVMTKPDATNLESADVRYTAHDHFEGGTTGNQGHGSSTLLKGILKDTNTDSKNTANLNMTIYGRAYAKSADGQLLLGAPVNRYAALNCNAIYTLNEIVGGVRITFDTDCTELHPTFYVGNTVTLNNLYLSMLITYRDYDIADGASTRGMRIMNVLQAMFNQLKEKIMADPTVALDVFNQLTDYITTDLKISEITYLARNIGKMDFSSDTVIRLPGETVMGEEYAEFHADQEWIRNFVVENFCVPVQ
jgi:hypothetical protein